MAGFFAEDFCAVFDADAAFATLAEAVVVPLLVRPDVATTFLLGLAFAGGADIADRGDDLAEDGLANPALDGEAGRATAGLLAPVLPAALLAGALDGADLAGLPTAGLAVAVLAGVALVADALAETTLIERDFGDAFLTAWTLPAEALVAEAAFAAINFPVLLGVAVSARGFLSTTRGAEGFAGGFAFAAVAGIFADEVACSATALPGLLDGDGSVLLTTVALRAP